MPVAPSFRAIAVLATVIMSLTACGSEDDGPDVAALGQSCSYGSGNCTGDTHCRLDLGACTLDCATDADCGSSSFHCTGAYGGDLCVRRCNEGEVVLVTNERWVCVDEKFVPCEGMPESECDRCGCGEDEYCVSGVGCEPIVELGQPCEVDLECPTPLDVCAGDGTSGLCATLCDSSEECSDGARCIGSVCLFECEDASDCPAGACVDATFLGQSIKVCDARLPNGAYCESFPTCQSAFCDEEAGMCSSCSSDADCPFAKCCSGFCGGGC